MTETEIPANIAWIRERIERAATRSGRSVEEITLIAVSKTVSAERIEAAYDTGIRHFGENYVQEAIDKIGEEPLDRPDIRWHFIGHLQSNKVRYIVGRFALIQSVDSVALAQEIARRSQQRQVVTPVLLEVKLDPSATRFGFDPEAVMEAVEEIAPLPGVEIRGLMGMAPAVDVSEKARPYFRRLRELFTQLPSEARQALSMGMTGDFEIAIEEGATHLRIGTAIFGKRANLGMRA